MLVDEISNWRKTKYVGEITQAAADAAPAAQRTHLKQMLSLMRLLERWREDTCSYHGLYGDQYYNGEKPPRVLQLLWTVIRAEGNTLELECDGDDMNPLMRGVQVEFKDEFGDTFVQQSFYSIQPNDRVIFYDPSACCGHISPSIVRIESVTGKRVTITVDATVSSAMTSSRSVAPDEDIIYRCVTARYTQAWVIDWLPHGKNPNRCKHCKRDYSDSLGRSGYTDDNGNRWICAKHTYAVVSGSETEMHDNGFSTTTYSYNTNNHPTGLVFFRGDDVGGNDNCFLLGRCDKYEPITVMQLTEDECISAGEECAWDSTHVGQWFRDMIVRTAGIVEQWTGKGEGTRVTTTYKYNCVGFPSLMTAFGGLRHSKVLVSSSDGNFNMWKWYRSDEGYLCYPESVAESHENEGYRIVWSNNLQKAIEEHYTEITYSIRRKRWTNDPQNNPPRTNNAVWDGYDGGWRIQGNGTDPTPNGGFRGMNRVTRLTTHDSILRTDGKANKLIATRRLATDAGIGTSILTLDKEFVSWESYAVGGDTPKRYRAKIGGIVGMPLDDKYLFRCNSDLVNIDTVHWGDRRGGLWQLDSIKIYNNDDIDNGKVYVVRSVNPCNSYGAFEEGDLQYQTGNDGEYGDWISVSTDCDDEEDAHYIGKMDLSQVLGDPEAWLSKCCNFDEITLYTPLSEVYEAGATVEFHYQLPPTHEANYE